jgi:uncharacterized membrane protein YhaH (DUF805 family)
MLKLFLLPGNRLPRSTFWLAIIAASLVFIVLFAGLDSLLGHGSTLVLYPPFFWMLFVLSSKRYHDLNRSAKWLLLLLIPLLGVLWVAAELAFRRGTAGENAYGADPLLPTVDYIEVR